MMHCGSDYWTLHGERIWKPTICAACKSDIGRNAKKAQDIELRKAMHEVAKQAFSSSEVQS
tara:strand:+ start:307 stop:489 length:183 start_codon:yes stop_codon:yes gene_type:complete